MNVSLVHKTRPTAGFVVRVEVTISSGEKDKTYNATIPDTGVTTKSVAEYIFLKYEGIVESGTTTVDCYVVYEVKNLF